MSLEGSCDNLRRKARPSGALQGQRPPGQGVKALLPTPIPIQTHMLCRTHQPQWGSREPRQSSHDVYCTQLSTGTRVTWQEGDSASRPHQAYPRDPF